MDISIRTKQISSVFSFDKKVKLEDTQLDIMPFRFVQTSYEDEIKQLQKELSTTGFCSVTDDCIAENREFNYTVFMPRRKTTSLAQGGIGTNKEDLFDKAIVLLHGLNERSWDKYLTWAEYLVEHTGRPVILFPIAFHMNRGPRQWNNPREVQSWVNLRKQEVGGLLNSTFANVALSYRISKQPLRFYVSGLQSAYNVLQLVCEIKEGLHPLFRRGTSINIFAYSIGAFLSQVLMLSNTDGLFSDTRLFMFCGGSIFSRMNGNARDILDKEASDRLMNYYINDFHRERPVTGSEDQISLEEAFRMMIAPDVMRERRESFFQAACQRIRAISLKRDIVIPTGGVVSALGKSAHEILREIDFPFDYSHQIPFPMRSGADRELVNCAFRSVFGQVADFLY